MAVTAATWVIVTGAVSPGVNDAVIGTSSGRAEAPIFLSILARTGPHNDRAGYFPTTIRVPAHASVVIRIVDYDGLAAVTGVATAVHGTVGGVVRVQSMTGADPGALGPARVLHALDSRGELAHTFTVPALGINVPVAAHAVETFTIRTGAPGVYLWRCHAPCSDDSRRTDDSRRDMGAMAKSGYMAGQLIVT